MAHRLLQDASYQVEPDVARLVEQHGEAVAVIDWAARLRVLGLGGEIGVIAPGDACQHRHLGQRFDCGHHHAGRPDEISVIIKDGRIVDRAAEGGFPQLRDEPPSVRMLAQ